MNISGYFQRLLHIDLDHRSSEIRPVDPELLSQTLGGKGLAVHLFHQLAPEFIHPFSADNPLIFALGPVTDTLVWGSSRLGVFTKSPLTGCFNESYAGGRAAISMSRTGFDVVIITGVAEKPVWLEISETGAVFHSAANLWGLDCPRTEAALKAECGPRSGALVIGPAGENLVRFAVLATDKWHMAGRGGTGAVMGSKRLKGIVFHGSARRQVYNPDALKSWSQRFIREHKHQPGPENYRKFGTTAMLDLMNTAGAFPCAYWTQGRLPDWESLSAGHIMDQLQAQPRSCPRCFLSCRKLGRISSGPYQGLRIEGPEYETLYAFGGLCLVSDVREIVYLNDLCDRLGMDTISAGNLTGMILEATRQGRLRTSLKYGHSQQIAQLLEQIALRKGLGGILALGMRQAANNLGLEDMGVQVKGMEPAGYDPRVLKGMGLAYAVSSRGACHLRSSFHRAELTGEVNVKDPSGLVASFLEHEDTCTLLDCLIVCRFFRKLYSREMPRIISLVTGLDIDMQTLRRMAGEIMDLTRMINLSQGIGPDQDCLPKHIMHTPLPDGSSIGEQEMHTLITEYYRQRGWDEQGIPGCEMTSSFSPGACSELTDRK
ncbi:MAG: aldehyde ferredoxin oxidoreductase family protein [Desulfovermiculus sp.]